jgi:hypothetical protein
VRSAVCDWCRPDVSGQPGVAYGDRMPFNATLLTVFVASPSDVGRERGLVVEQVNTWNRRNAVAEHVAFVPVAWEWAVATQGESGQEQINRQQVRSADVVIALFKSRLGQATAGCESGTAEEISIGEEYGAHVAVLIGTNIDSRPDPTEYARLDNYLRSVRARGLTKNFATDQDLAENIHEILTAVCRKHRTSAMQNESTTSDRQTNTPAAPFELTTARRHELEGEARNLIQAERDRDPIPDSSYGRLFLIAQPDK